ncbi:tyrosine-type recombinase/integrase [Rhodopila sp.]|uniref:tyrosine-type recombinase/integrase n=1 Tax=Rhodopila sp. TaxID=2480087 RepID=UPI003D0C3623
MPKLTKRTVEDAEIRAVDYFIWCDELAGFGLRIYPSGKRGYLIQYRSKGRTRRVKLGVHGRVTCEQARKEAIGLFGQIARGEDPAEDREGQRAAMTVSQLCDSYMVAVEAGTVMGKRGLPKKTLTIRSDIGRINGHIRPLLGRRLVRDLTPVDIGRFIRDVTEGKTAKIAKTTKMRGKSIVTGGRGVASRSAGLLGGILSFAMSDGIIPVNPAIGAKKPAYAKRTARLSPDDYGALGAALDAAAQEGVNVTAVAAARLLALTGCRKGEILGLRWTEVDEPGHAFRMVDTKEGASVRPIGGAAFEILGQLARREGSVWVLPGEHRDLPYGGLGGAWRAILGRTKLAGVTPHTLRHSFASMAGDAGYSEPTIAALLGHASGTVTSRYTHILDTVLIAAADRVAAQIRACMVGTASGVRPNGSAPRPFEKNAADP